MSKDREELIEVMARRLRLKAWAGRPDSDWDEPGKIDEDNKQAWRDEASADISAIEAAGLVVVPREPTAEMKDAAYEADLDIYWCYASDGRPGGPNDVYRAMINAYSPKTSGGDAPPTTEEEGA